jgi:dynein heavy chain
LGDPLEISDWINFGLPKDSFSIDNAVLVKKSSKNPVLIDPQLQASKWLKSYKKGDDLVNVKLNN